jgi:uncharacterized protein (TIGR04222 family)
MSAELLRRIEGFDIDGRPATLPFAARLAREHGWPRRFADRVVAEYKRFAYLAATCGHPVTPSQAVDHCWHLHLTYTRSYWERFCREVLPGPLHHDPTAGGRAERSRYHAQYERTLAAYRAAFGHPPPADIWPPAAVRFGDDLREATVNTARHWVVPKRPVKAAAAAVGAVALAGCGGDLDPFALNGPDFLLVFGPALLAAFGLGLLVRQAGRGGGPADPPPLGWQQTALLTDGPERLTEAAVARLAATGMAALSDDGKTLSAVGSPPTDLSPAERTVLAGLPLSSGDQMAVLKLALAVGEATTDVRRQLDDAGLTVPDDRSRWVGWLSAVPLAAVLVGLGLPRLITGVGNGKPVGFLVVGLVLGTLVAGLMRVCRPYRTRAGSRLRAALQRQPAPADPAMAVATLGGAALAGTELAALYAWYPRRQADAESGVDAGGDSGGDGGGCGGGCGGCGGGGGD